MYFSRSRKGNRPEQEFADILLRGDEFRHISASKLVAIESRSLFEQKRKGSGSSITEYLLLARAGFGTFAWSAAWPHLLAPTEHAFHLIQKSPAAQRLPLIQR